MKKILLHFRNYTDIFSFYRFVFYRNFNVWFLYFRVVWNYFNITIKQKTLDKITYNCSIAYYFIFRNNLTHIWKFTIINRLKL